MFAGGGGGGGGGGLEKICDYYTYIFLLPNSFLKLTIPIVHTKVLINSTKL